MYGQTAGFIVLTSHESKQWATVCMRFEMLKFAPAELSELLAPEVQEVSRDTGRGHTDVTRAFLDRLVRDKVLFFDSRLELYSLRE